MLHDNHKELLIKTLLRGAGSNLLSSSFYKGSLSKLFVSKVVNENYEKKKIQENTDVEILSLRPSLRNCYKNWQMLFLKKTGEHFLNSVGSLCKLFDSFLNCINFN